MSLNIPYSDLQIENNQLVSTNGISKKNISSLDVGTFSIANGGGIWNKISNVTQITSDTTSVTSNSVAGSITTVSLTTAAANNFSFTVNNSYCTSTSFVLLQLVSYSGTIGTDGIPILTSSPSSGAFNVNIYNGGSAALAGTIKFLYIIF